MKKTYQLVWIIILMLFFFSCNQEKKEWRKVKSIYTIKAFDEFLSRHPQGDYYKLALKEKERLEKLQNPNFISWLSDKSENELGELNKNGIFVYKFSNIEKWGTFYEEWNKIVESFVPEEIYKDPNFISWLSDKSENELGELKKDGKFDYSYFNNKKWETFYKEWNKIVESFVPEEIYKDPDFITWLSKKSKNELGELKKDGKFDYNFFNNKKWETFYEKWDKISEPFLIEEAYYNQNGVVNLRILKNSNGIIAKKVLIPTSKFFQPAGIGFQYPDKKDFFFIIDYAGKKKESKSLSHTTMWLCLDKKGRIIKEDNRPKFIKAPYAIQSTVFENEYHGAFIIKTTSKIFPSQNQYSTNKKIYFVWY